MTHHRPIDREARTARTRTATAITGRIGSGSIFVALAMIAASDVAGCATTPATPRQTATPIAAPRATSPASPTIDTADRTETERLARTEETRAIALRFLRMVFVDHDIRRAYDSMAVENMIQHNPHIPDGLAGHRAFFAELQAKRGKTSQWADALDAIIVDGDLFALHHHVFTAPDDPGRVFVDIWRVANGKIVEHWDVIQSIPAEMAHANGVGCGDTKDFDSTLRVGVSLDAPTCGLPDATASRADSLTVLDQYTGALRSGDVRAATERWLTDDYRQHSPGIADGKEGATAFLTGEFGKGADRQPKMGPMRLIAEGDLVLAHRLTTYADGTRSANVDIFRIRHGQISEHWDIKQEIPDHAANNNGMW